MTWDSQTYFNVFLGIYCSLSIFVIVSLFMNKCCISSNSQQKNWGITYWKTSISDPWTKVEKKVRKGPKSYLGHGPDIEVLRFNFRSLAKPGHIVLNFSPIHFWEIYINLLFIIINAAHVFFEYRFLKVNSIDQRL